MVDNGRVDRKNALDADAEAHFADGHRFARAAVLAGDDDAFKNLKTLFVAFLDANVNLNGVARLKSRTFSLICVCSMLSKRFILFSARGDVSESFIL
jgi:hypothetical protein